MKQNGMKRSEIDKAKQNETKLNRKYLSIIDSPPTLALDANTISLKGNLNNFPKETENVKCTTI